MNIIATFKNSAVWKFLVKIQEWILTLASIFVVLIMCVEVFLRYVVKSDLFGLEEIVVIAAFWLYFMGSSYGVYEKSHVKADIIPQMLKPGQRAFLSVLIHFTMAALCILYSAWAVEMVHYSIVWMPRTTGLRIPIFISQTSILAGYVLMSLYSIVYFFEELFHLLDTGDGKNSQESAGVKTNESGR
ncbi:TRAP-type C4-dicarboxylate transport system, small permease component [Acetomicrobium thermoterrenum DSM 13490]|uniref:TRAP-type C4-dicarboxylate transport system, small permease component n=1 Tax=Acetomicrobium thermoterrenum DSM 13490 TaxID=1120987 RepID=A0A1H3FDV7_9BACT|nr:TRAP transporter small permease subunit [Acetomicrobium thermoterrenum]SDX89161.1 TRAP-type C4-dicarboxylate transport system, small permease component [Acetomicrobium thermoterrenum DSM 13490]